jgi:hypothetical protein
MEALEGPLMTYFMTYSLRGSSSRASGAALTRPEASLSVVAPVAATAVAPVWRSSCGRTEGNPIAMAARRKVEFQLLRAR